MGIIIWELLSVFVSSIPPGFKVQNRQMSGWQRQRLPCSRYGSQSELLKWDGQTSAGHAVLGLLEKESIHDTKFINASKANTEHCLN